MSISTTPTRVYDPHWSNTYIGFGNKDGGPRAWFVDGVVDWLYNLENNGKEEFVMHQWGDGDAENCIHMTRYDNTITFTIYSKAFAYPWIDWCYFPSIHDFMIYVRPVGIDGNGNYNRVEYCVYDLDTNTAYVKTFTLPRAEHIKDVDIALEKYYEDGEPRPGMVNSWKYVRDFHAYDLSGSMLNLPNNEHIFEYYTDNVANYYYRDLYGYYGNIYITRYDPRYSPPPHP